LQLMVDTFNVLVETLYNFLDFFQSAFKHHMVLINQNVGCSHFFGPLGYTLVCVRPKCFVSQQVHHSVPTPVSNRCNTNTRNILSKKTYFSHYFVLFVLFFSRSGATASIRVSQIVTLTCQSVFVLHHS